MQNLETDWEALALHVAEAGIDALEVPYKDIERILQANLTFLAACKLHFPPALASVIDQHEKAMLAVHQALNTALDQLEANHAYVERVKLPSEELQ